MADVRPIEVVKQASDTAIASIVLPVLPRRALVILTITLAACTSWLYTVDTVAPK